MYLGSFETSSLASLMRFVYEIISLICALTMFTYNKTNIDKLVRDFSDNVRQFSSIVSILVAEHTHIYIKLFIVVVYTA